MKLVNIRMLRKSYNLSRLGYSKERYLDLFDLLLKRMGLNRPCRPPYGKKNFFCDPKDLVPKK